MPTSGLSSGSSHGTTRRILVAAAAGFLLLADWPMAAEAAAETAEAQLPAAAWALQPPPLRQSPSSRTLAPRADLALDLTDHSESTRRLASCPAGQYAISAVFSITSGLCTVDSDAKCFRSPNYPSNYGVSQTCSIAVLKHATISPTSFVTEISYDKVGINGDFYSGTISSSTEWIVSSGTSITWISDSSEVFAGFEICSTCPLCAPGKFSASSGAESCSSCDAGKSSYSGSSSCGACPAGSFVNGLVCALCSAGSYTSSADATSCVSCAVGTFSASSGAESCSSCNAGKSTYYSGSSSCGACPAGSFVNGLVCILCPAGTYSASSEASSCVSCDAGAFFDPSSGLATCDFDSGFCDFSNTGAYAWTRLSGATPDSYTGPTADHTSGLTLGTGSYMYVEGSSPNYPSKGPFVLQMSTTGGHLVAVAFYYHMYGSSMGTLSVDTSADGVTWTSHFAKSGNQGNVWKYATVPISGTDTFLRFLGTSGSSSSTDMAIDDVSVETMPVASSCRPCAAGTYASSTGSTTCVSCAAGTYSPSTGRTTSCTDTCGAGSAPSGGISCLQCDAGRYTSNTGEASCILCAYGKSSTVGSSSCGLTPTPITTEVVLRTAVTAWCTNAATAAATYGAVELWDVSALTSISQLFSVYCSSKATFNEDLSSWDIGRVSSMYETFRGCTLFEGSGLSSWDFSEVTRFSGTFWDCKIFNPDVTSWDVGKVTSMYCMFNKARSFVGGGLSAWDVSRTKDLGYTFADIQIFNGDVSTWDVSSVTNIGGMFGVFTWAETSVFNQDISRWDVGKITSLYQMFLNAQAFNQDLSQWDVSRMDSLYESFYGAKSFNQVLCWDVSGKSTSFMFTDSLGSVSTTAAKCVCPAGSYSVNENNFFTNCTFCPAGTYSAVDLFKKTATLSKCTACTSGKASMEGSLTCTSCSPGYFAADASATGTDAATLVTEGAPLCSPCPAGYYTEISGSLTCTACASGTANPTPGSSSCEVCAAGKASSAASANCTNCYPGTFKTSAGLGVCGFCAAGKYASSTGSTACQDCPAGTAQGASGGSSCPDCLSGYTSASAQSACTACGAGQYAASSIACAKCPAGSAQGSTGASACLECVPGYFSGDFGQSLCGACPGNFYSIAGATVCSLCLRGFYFTVDATCESCPTGTLCSSDGGAVQSKLLLEAGYWRISPVSVDVQACPLSNACVGGIGSTAVERRELRELLGEEGSFSDGYCGKGYTGPLCGVCDPNGYFFSPGEQACIPCTSGSEATMFYSPTMLVLLGAFVFASCFTLLNFCSMGEAKGAERKSRAKAQGDALVAAAKTLVGSLPDNLVFNPDGSITASHSETVEAPPTSREHTVKVVTGLFDATSTTIVSTKASLTSTLKIVIKPSNRVIAMLANFRGAQVKFKSLVSFGQISINVGFNCAVSWPSTFERILDSLKVMNLDVMPSLGLQCKLSRFDYIDRMVASTLGPAAVVLVLGLVYFYQVARAVKPEDAVLRKRAESYHIPENLRDAFEPSELHGYKVIFAAMDENGSGTIEKPELERVLARASRDTSSKEELESEAKMMMAEASLDGDESISVEEFMIMMHRARRQGRNNKFATLADKVEAGVSRRAGNVVVYGILFFTYLVLISSSTAVFHFFKCKTFDVPEEDGGGSERYLDKDYSVDCERSRYRGYVAYAILMVVVYPVGIPLFYATLLLKKRKTLRDPVAMDRELANDFPTVGHLAFLVEAYKPDFFYFEVFECFRRLALASAIGIVDEKSAISPVIGILISLGFIHVFTKWSPYKTDSDNSLGVTLAHALVLFFLAALLVKVDVTKDDPQEQALFGAFLSLVLFSGPIAIAFRLFSGRTFSLLSLAYSCICSRMGAQWGETSRLKSGAEVELAFRSKVKAEQGNVRDHVIILDGKAVAMARKCKCGNVLKEDSIFCRRCGSKRLTEEEAKAAEAAAATASSNLAETLFPAEAAATTAAITGPAKPAALPAAQPVAGVADEASQAEAPEAGAGQSLDGESQSRESKSVQSLSRQASGDTQSRGSQSVQSLSRQASGDAQSRGSKSVQSLSRQASGDTQSRGSKSVQSLSRQASGDTFAARKHRSSRGDRPAGTSAAASGSV